MPTSADTFYLPPTRGDKRILALPVTAKTLPFEGRSGAGGSYGPATGELVLTPAAFDQLRVARKAYTAAGLTDFIYIKLRGRAEGGGDLQWQFPVNPESIQVNRQVLDAESLTRAGLQTGIWGDLLDITIQGVTAGQYFAGVLVDAYSENSRSGSSLQELVALYENNGTWFEGEATGNVAAAASYTRKQIQFQNDVVLAFGNFIWQGCFTEMSTDDGADTPYYNKFTLGFMAWKERFRGDSPWRSSIANEQYFGHAFEACQRPQRKGSGSPSLSLAKQAAAYSSAAGGGRVDSSTGAAKAGV